MLPMQLDRFFDKLFHIKKVKECEKIEKQK